MVNNRVLIKYYIDRSIRNAKVKWLCTAIVASFLVQKPSNDVRTGNEASFNTMMSIKLSVRGQATSQLTSSHSIACRRS